MFSPQDKQYYTEMYNQLIEMIEGIEDTSNTVKTLLKNAFIKILTAERGLNWVLCMRVELGTQGGEKMKEVLNYLSLLAADRALEPSFKHSNGLTEFLAERNLAPDENPLVRLARLIRQRRYFSQDVEGETIEDDST